MRWQVETGSKGGKIREFFTKPKQQSVEMVLSLAFIEEKRGLQRTKRSPVSELGKDFRSRIV